MNNHYDPERIESRWQAYWAEHRTFEVSSPGDPGFDATRPKYYVLDMFPYPSGAGLHVGHPTGYIGTDIIARRKRMEGYSVLHPMGYDAFGLPAEQYALQTGEHPARTTERNMATFRSQLRAIGLSYDWSRELATCRPEYYHWTQWIFARLYDRGLAYRAEVPVWWCEGLKTVLANEEVINGRSERGDYPCERRPLMQWMLKITAYADRLLADLDELDWPESIKSQQREWIGRSEGAEITFALEGAEGALTAFTTRPDTLYGATFMVVAPEHPLVDSLCANEQRDVVAAYREQASKKSELQRTDLAKTKSGVFTGSYALNPLMAKGDPAARLPIWVSDYVLMAYGTGVIMCVPGHDERDYEFARTFGLAVRYVVRPAEGPEPAEGCTSNEGVAIHSPEWNGLSTAEATQRSIEVLEKLGIGARRVSYRLRDWLFSRQRYWGEPFPVLYREDGSHFRVPDEELPVRLPDMQDFRPRDDGSPPLAHAADWVRVRDPKTGEIYRRDTDTMPGWAGSCWYYLRFTDPHNQKEFASREALDYWGAVDLYVGGAEHAVLHLLYARFWHKVLFDEGLVPTKEPFQRLFNQGMLQAFAYRDETGRLVPADEVDDEATPAVLKATGKPVERVVAKISKSLKNVVNPDEVCAQYGVDTFRLYEMFMGPLGDSKPWNPRDVSGCRRFLDRLWRLLIDPEGSEPLRPHLARNVSGEPRGDRLVVERAWNKCLKRVDDSFERLNFNTAVAAFMEFLAIASRTPEAVTRELVDRLVRALSPFAPHLAEELWSRLGHEGESICGAPWPAVDERYLTTEDFELIVQVNGKVRGRARAPVKAEGAALEDLARAAVAESLEGCDVIKTVVVPGRLVNFVVRS